ncbi:hypothetical protein CKM354_000049100 [Cercospora kikuchii]|uniref:Zinc finger PHD-type domain-containing protein n=1 Tax=Cercospora kikuchii TaxID=84275 RepID=A0A9P3C640_9PEZI|nr:uncharacterized protein CKM354_000049100 [Cercospora kikuchii]GIZ37028.1 hypothetical protein CKM354_000049100 [Cercospora kikuchii]
MNPPYRAAPPVRIKQEAVDDDEPMDRSPTPQEELFVAQAPARERAKDSQGRTFSTQCFEAPYLQRPHFHRLKCEHDIVTVEPEICGSNCMPATRDTGSDLKAAFKPFECPDPSHYVGKQVFAPKKNPKTGRQIKGRVCQLGHVRGRSQEADNQWEKQKLELAQLKSRSLHPPEKYKALLRKTSQSPERREDPPIKSSRRRASTIVTADELNASMDSATRTLLLAQNGRQTRRIRGDRLETETDRVFDYAERKIGMMGFENVAPAKRRSRPAKSRKSNTPGISTSMHPTRACDICGECGKALTEELYRCQQCKENNSEFILCGSCNASAYHLHLRDHPSHLLVLEDIRGGEWSNVGEAKEHFATHCTCRSMDLQYMLQCDTCSKSFHPGCVGKGLQVETHYDLPDRDKFLKADFEHFRQAQDEVFTCKKCDALDLFENGIAKQRKRARLHADFLLQYLPKLMKQKGVMMKRAVSDEQRAVVDAHFAAIEEEMEEGKVLTDGHWRALLAKSQQINLPPPNPQKRDAMEMDEPMEMDEQTPDQTNGGDVAQSVPVAANDGPAKRTKVERPGQPYRLGVSMTLRMDSRRKD